MTDPEDVRAAIRYLLEHRTVLADNPRRPGDREIFTLIRRNLTTLRRWFNDYPRYDLAVEAGWARLTKTPLDDSAPPRDLTPPQSKRPFGRRRYVWLCLALAAIDRLEERRMRLGTLAEEIEALALQEDLRAPNLDVQSDRAAIADVFRLLEEEGVVRLRDGDVQSFVDTPDGDALYEVDRALGARLLAARRPPSLCTTPDEVRRELYPQGPDGDRLRIRHTLWRRLLESPVVYYDTLTDAERQYLDGQRSAFARELRERCGLVLEVRAEGVAAVQPDLRDADFPPAPYGSLAIAVATLHRQLAGADVGSPQEPVPLTDLRISLAGMITDTRTSQAYREDGGERLLDDALDLMSRAGLVRRLPDGVVPLAVLRRYVFHVHDSAAPDAGPGTAQSVAAPASTSTAELFDAGGP